MGLLKEYEEVKEELEKFTKVATSIGTINLEDMRATLSIYGKLFQEYYSNDVLFTDESRQSWIKPNLKNF